MNFTSTYNLHKWSLSILLLFMGFLTYGQSLRINEFMASNTSTISDPAGDFDDWVEIYNAGNSPVISTGLYMTDDFSNKTKWLIPNGTVIPANGFLLIWLDNEASEGPLHANFKLGADGEVLGIFRADNSAVDSFTFGAQVIDISVGSSPDGSSNRVNMQVPSPGQSNVPSTSLVVATPVASVVAGPKNAPFNLTLTSASAAAKIRYTLDGSEPTSASALYSTPLLISQSSNVRAKAFIAGYNPSSTMTSSYLFGANHTFPIISLTYKEADFFGPSGIYTLYEQELDAPVYVEMFETDGSLAFKKPAKAEISGTASAVYPQKSLNLKASSDGISTYYEYPIFPTESADRYKRLLLRNSGQDWCITQFHDPMVISLVGDLSDLPSNIIKKPDLYLQGFRPGIAYYNGKYFGMYNLMERADKTYISERFNLSESQFDLIENENEIKTGDMTEWSNFFNYLSNNNFQTDAKYRELAGKIDIKHFIDYNVLNIYADNTDWPSNNNRRWRERKATGQWRFLSFDHDFTFGLYGLDGSWNTGNASVNSLVRNLDATSINWPNTAWSTLMLRRCLENNGFRYAFINRMADQLNVLYTPQRINSRIDEFKTQYQPEIQKHLDKWNGGWNIWNENITKLRNFANLRTSFMRQHIVDYFPEVYNIAKLNVNALAAQGGEVTVSTITPQTLPWEGTYFTGIPIPVTARPKRGYVFSGWSDNFIPNRTDSRVTIFANKSLTAYFTAGSTQTGNIVINEINYNSPDAPNSGDWAELYNAGASQVDMSGWYFEDESGEYFGLPANTKIAPGAFLVLVEDSTSFKAVYPTVTNYIGGFGGDKGFKFNNSSERISLNNAAHVRIDTVRYANTAPWPTEPNGTGKTLQLKDAALDNALASSWKPDAATPGVGNNSSVVVINVVPYCNSKGNAPWQEWISKVELASISHNSSKEQYADFTNIKTTLNKGTSYPIKLTPGLSWAGYQSNLYWRVWIDYNGDGDFLDSNEKVFETNNISQVANGIINVPSNVIATSSRMRVSMKKGAYAEPCETFYEGEVQDYGINFAGGSNPPSNTPDLALTLTVNTSNVGIYAPVIYTLKVSNTGGVASENVSALLNYIQTGNMAYTTHSASKGIYNTWLGDWNIGSLAPNESVTLTLTLFTLSSAPVTQFAQVTSGSAGDPDSSPNNDNDRTANEDDEASITVGPGIIQLVSEAQIAELALTRIYPNPVSDWLYLDIESKIIGEQSLDIVDAQGKSCLQRSFDTQLGHNQVVIDASNLAAGAYYILINNKHTRRADGFIKL